MAELLGRQLEHEVRREALEVPFERLAFTFAWEQPDPDDVENLVELMFVNLGDSTRVSMRQAPFKTEPRWALHRAGWDDSFDKLERLLSRGEFP